MRHMSSIWESTYHHGLGDNRHGVGSALLCGWLLALLLSLLNDVLSSLGLHHLSLDARANGHLGGILAHGSNIGT